MIRPLRLALAALTVGMATSLPAQVGYRPEQSPYEDLPGGQHLSASGGWLATRRDPAGVGPKAGAFGALRYDISIGGPAAFYVRYSFAPSKRDVLVPANPPATRVLESPSTSTHIFDTGLDISLTGQKSWRKLAPSLVGGAGIVSDFAALDTGSYKFGTKFAFTYGLAVRYIPNPNGLAFRVDLTSYTWQYRYPDRYFVAGTNSTPILTDTRQRSAYRSNWGLSAGVTVPLFR